MQKRVLVGFGDALAAPETIFSLADAGFAVDTFLRELSDDRPFRHLPVTNCRRIPAPERSAEQAVSALTEILLAGDYIALLCLDDVSLWLLSWIDRAGQALPTGIANVRGHALTVTLDKRLQLQSASQAGLSIPETIHVSGMDDLNSISDFPAIMKPALAVHADNGRIAKGESFYLLSTADIDDVRRSAKFDAPYLIQPLIQGTGEGVFGFASPSGISAFFGHRRIRMMNPHGSGASACESTAPDAEICRKVTAMMQDLNWRGPFMIELLRDENGTLWFMELNGRLWGSTALARRCGFDFPMWAIRQALDPQFEPTAPSRIPKIRVRHLGRDILHLLFVLKGTKSAFHRTNWPRILPAALSVFRPSRPGRFYNFHRKYPTFFIRDAVATIKKTLTKRS